MLLVTRTIPFLKVHKIMCTLPHFNTMPYICNYYSNTSTSFLIHSCSPTCLSSLLKPLNGPLPESSGTTSTLSHSFASSTYLCSHYSTSIGLSIAHILSWLLVVKTKARSLPEPHKFILSFPYITKAAHHVPTSPQSFFFSLHSQPAHLSCHWY